MEEEVKIITDYFAIWGWQLIATLFLIASLITFAMPENISQKLIFVIFLASFIVFQFISFKKKNDFYKQ